MDAKLKKGTFGYNSKEVEAYVLELSSGYDNEIKAKSDVMAKLSAKVTELESKISVYEADRLRVAEALVKAQKEAQEIMDNAVADSIKEKEKISKEYDSYVAKIDEAKKTLLSLRTDALDLVENYKELIEKFSDLGGSDGD